MKFSVKTLEQFCRWPGASAGLASLTIVTQSFCNASGGLKLQGLASHSLPFQGPYRTYYGALQGIERPSGLIFLYRQSPTQSRPQPNHTQPPFIAFRIEERPFDAWCGWPENMNPGNILRH